jgi:hypothetical protein
MEGRRGIDMTTHRRWLPHVLVAMIAFVGVAAAHAGPAGKAGNTGKSEDATTFSEAKILIEFNSTDEDVGIQVLLDGEPWKDVRASDPNGRRLLDITTRASLMTQGLPELFFESSEPSLADVPLEEFLARFPAGTYAFEGRTVDGLPVTGEAILSHVIPAGPTIVSPASSNEDPPVVDPNDFVIEWEPVTETVDGSEDLTIAGYQVIVEQEEPLRVFSVDLPAAATRVRVPAEFFEQRDTEHVFEVLAIEAGGNQTITEAAFVTAP